MGRMALPMKKAVMKAAAMKKTSMKAAVKPAMKGAMKAAAMKKVTMKKAAKKKAMKVKRMSKVAKGRGAKARVLSGSKAKTVGGLTAASLTRSKTGKVVSKKASARAKKAFQSSPLKVWADACKKARKALGLTGFVPMGGKTAAGKALLAKAKSLMQA